MEEIRGAEEEYVKHVYRQIIALALVAHLSYVAIFIWVGLPKLSIYCMVSVIVYSVMQKAAARGYYSLAVSCTHIEVCVFAIACTLVAGWGIGSALYLVAMVSLVYFCPFKHKYVSYFFAGADVGVFLALKLYTGLIRPGYLAIPEKTGLWLYLYSACICFFVILYAAFLSRVSAAVGSQELRDKNSSLTALVNYDELTGLLSRHAFLERLEKCRGETTVLVLSDIDDFKKVNDTYGHACGDQVLNESAELIRSQLGGAAEVSRWGGEEFVYLFRDLPLPEVLEKVQALCDTVAAHTFHCNGADLHITMTFGVSPDMEGLSPEELVALADARMYEGKIAGKNTVVYCNVKH